MWKKSVKSNFHIRCSKKIFEVNDVVKKNAKKRPLEKSNQEVENKKEIEETQLDSEEIKEETIVKDEEVFTFDADGEYLDDYKEWGDDYDVGTEKENVLYDIFKIGEKDKKIEKYAQIQDKHRVKKEDKARKLAKKDRVLDERTYLMLHKWLNQGQLDRIEGIISAGKEANVYFGYGFQQKPIAIKIYEIDSRSTRWMRKYLQGDPRFGRIGKSADKIIFTWARKEYMNLKLLKKHKIKAPAPLFVRNNILLMEYIGESNGTPAPRLKDYYEFENINKEISDSCSYIMQMYQKAKIVHGDLSEFNILYYNGDQYIIDVSQAVSIYHPSALEFLTRDIKNIYNFWNRFEPNPFDMEELYYEIVQP